MLFFSKKKIDQPEETVVAFGWSQWTAILLEAAHREGIVSRSRSNISLLVIDQNGQLLTTLTWGDRNIASGFALGFNFWTDTLLEDIIQHQTEYHIRHAAGATLRLKCFRHDGALTLSTSFPNLTLPRPTPRIEQPPTVSVASVGELPGTTQPLASNEETSLYDHLLEG